MKIHSRAIVVAVLVLCGLVGTSRAATLAIEKVTATPYAELAVASEFNVPGNVLVTARPPAGSVFVAVLAELTVTWDANSETLRVEADKIGLFDGDKPVGQRDGRKFAGLMIAFGTDINYYRGGTWKDKPQRTQLFLGVFVVPADKKELTLKIGAASGKFTVAGEPKKIDPASLVKVTAAKAELVDSTEQTFKLRDANMVNVTTNPGGKLLKVTVTVEPTAGNFDNGTGVYKGGPAGFVWSSADVCVQVAPGVRVAALGQSVPHNMGVDAAKDKWLAYPDTLVFPVPADTKEVELVYLGVVVAKVSVGK
jgi:hypothetical protein